ncbi:MAG: FAD-dependent oxidoreductase [Deltaproteobacteria bacterium]|nr:FAD-dependent oxidoreductase [Deltaproteobacteria bacterium]MBW1920955.1 FAD-dependent oxidoreductase [Deltaproteobacteria bacterium]MBW1935269.1 FAD-dependent oxidoreductase [Deltaproteobacteria bacterium]MBW2044216.1 FAD-dependent oxidoreductase [Deltaproteobacteria bacterium]
MEKRITKHPILEIPKRKEVEFTWNGENLVGYEGETIASSLVANGINVFGHHAKDGSPQGIFCANGQCSQCLVMANGLPVKSCMTRLEPGMAVESIEGLPDLPEDDSVPLLREPPVREVEVLIIGGGPAGLSAAVELGKRGIDTLLVDDKSRLGGKLVLQTHKFFGSVEDSHAGTRGFEIARILEQELSRLSSVEIWLNATAVGVFSDGIVGIVKDKIYRKIIPLKLLVASGAREKMLSFPGNTLPGVYGAGAFQTLVNRDLVRASEKILVVGGGNVGLIAGYHAIQAGIGVVALVEALPQVGGYRVHADKLRRLGVPIYTGHTVVSASGRERVESVTIAQLDKDWRVMPGTYKTFEVDTVLIAVGLAEVNEFYLKAREWGMDAYAAGDAREIAEASAAMFTGKIEGLKIARSLGLYEGEIPKSWKEKEIVLKSKPGPSVKREKPKSEDGVMPIFHCYQEVPCNPCASVCPEGAIKMEGDEIMGLPYMVEQGMCKGCLNCVFVCPGLAVTLVDYRNDSEHPTVTLPYEIWREKVEIGEKIPLTDEEGAVLGYYPVEKVITNRKKYPGTLLIQVRVEKNIAKEVAGIWVQEKQVEPSLVYEKELPPDEAIICRCERVTAGEIRAAIRGGVRDMNQLKALTRAGMGACGSKTCRPMILRIFEEEGIDLSEVTDRTDRPLFVEVPLGVLAGMRMADKK